MLYLTILIIIFVADVESKKWFLNNVIIYKKIYILPHLNLTHIHNYGIILGYLSNIPKWIKWIIFFIEFNIIFLVIKTINIQFPSIKKNIKIYYSCIIGGALGNLYDRIYHGFVIDFIELNFNTWNLITFNIADIFIFIGIIFIIILSFLNGFKTN